MFPKKPIIRIGPVSLLFAGGRRGPAPRRVADVVVALTLLVVTAPLTAAAAAAIAASSGRPVLFRQLRSGLDGADFSIVKFRTFGPQLYNGQPDEERVDRVGRALRASSIDELPQLWNVLRGDMSIIGPRPTLPEQTRVYSDRERGRLTVAPGITGWAQVHGRQTLSWPERIELDLWYLEHRCVRLDLEILMRTVGQLIRPSGTADAEWTQGRPSLGVAVLPAPPA